MQRMYSNAWLLMHPPSPIYHLWVWRWVLPRFGLLEKWTAWWTAVPARWWNVTCTRWNHCRSEREEEWHRVRLRTLQVCEEAAAKNVGVLIDAEETWIQDPVDALTILMMDTFNKTRPLFTIPFSCTATTGSSFLKRLLWSGEGKEILF